MHVALRAENVQPLKVNETIGSRHDGPVSKNLTHTEYIMVMDRVYGKLGRLDRYKEDGQSFVIRLRDITCQLGTTQCRSKKRHRVVIFQDFKGRGVSRNP